MSIPAIGETYVHIKSGKAYQVQGTTMFKLGIHWVMSIRYRSPLHDEEFTRTVEDFSLNFKRASEES
jgi:hypothetical protein